MDKALSSKLSTAHKYYKEGRTQNEASQLLLTESSGYLEPEEGEKTYKVSQEKLKPLVPIYNSRLVISTSDLRPQA
jgi:hypothetical protein